MRGGIFTAKTIVNSRNLIFRFCDSIAISFRFQPNISFFPFVYQVSTLLVVVCLTK